MQVPVRRAGIGAGVGQTLPAIQVPGAGAGHTLPAIQVPGAGAGQTLPAIQMPGAAAGLRCFWCRCRLDWTGDFLPMPVPV